MNKNVRYKECSRCGQCCGADGLYLMGWPRTFPKKLEQYTEEELEKIHPVIALIGIPKHTGITSGSVVVGDRIFPYEWRDRGGVVSPGTEERCPFLYYHKHNGPWLCGLVDTEEQWRWERICQPWPSSEAWMVSYPKCSYKWKRVDVRNVTLYNEEEAKEAQETEEAEETEGYYAADD